jgi:hypothetical protein
VLDARALRAATNAYARKVDRDIDVATLVSNVASALTLDMLEEAVRAEPEFWTRGEGAHSRRVVKDNLELVTKMTGELLALKHRTRDIVLTQVMYDASWEPPCSIGDCIHAPYAASVLEDLLAEDDDIKVKMSLATYPDGAGATAVVYRASTASARADMLVELGAQAARPMPTVAEQVLVGLALGYSEANIAHHARRVHGDIPTEALDALFVQAREALVDLGEKTPHAKSS